MTTLMLKKWRVLSGDYGFVICFILSIVLLLVFFSEPMFHANTVFFGNSGDGLMTYYNSIYHVLYDKSYVYQQAMNYPYQESVFFTACHPVVTDIIKAVGLGAYTIGIINLTMLLSLPLSAWFLYFIFREFGVGPVLAGIGSVAVAYLSPQVARLNSHYTLAYCFAIPAIIFFALRFYRSPQLKKSLLIAVLVFFMASTHMYFFVFYLMILGWMWLTYFFVHGVKRSWLLFLKHFLIQAVIPFLLLQIMIFLLNDYTDRTKNPAGFLDYLSNLYGVFYPHNRWYEGLFTLVGIKNGEVSWEGLAYVGLGATLLCIFICLKFVKNLFTLRFSKLFAFTSYPFLNGMIICAIFSLLYSFGWPFIFDHEDWVDKIGFLKQIRSLGRFAWIFYYVINIALIVVISELPDRLEKYRLKTIISTIALIVLLYDACSNINKCNRELSNNIPELTDIKNQLPQNKWVEKIKGNEFQAILPFPWFHVGSENFYFPPDRGMDINSYVVSLKTGLPVINVIGARVSLQQTFANLELVTEPNGKVPDILTKFKSKKDILLLLPKDPLKSPYETAISSKASPLDETDKFYLKRLPYDSLVAYYKQFARKKIEGSTKRILYKNEHCLSTDSTHNYVANSFGGSGNNFLDKLNASGIPRNYFCIFNDSLKQLTADSLFTFSFWMNNIKEDQQVHQVIAVESSDNGKVYTPLYAATELNVKQLNGNWALFECTFKLHKSTNPVRVVLWNPKFSEKRTDVIDDILFRPAGTDVYRIFPKFMLINNCVYYYD